MLAGLVLMSCLVPAPARSDSGPLVLRGTLVAHGTQGYAIVEDTSRHQQRHYRSNSRIVPGVRLLGVYADHAVIEDAQGRRRLDFGARIDGSADLQRYRYHIDRAALADIIAAVELIPHQQNGRIVGYYANRVAPAVSARVGLQPGDIIDAVDHLKLDSQTRPERLYRLLQAPQFDLHLRRRGRPITISYRLK